MRRAAPVAVLVVIAGVGPGASGSGDWMVRWPDTVAEAIVAHPESGRLYATGWTYRHTDDILVAGHGPNGSPIWSNRYNGRDNGFDRPWDIAVAPNDSMVVVAGETGGRPGHAVWSDSFVGALDASSGHFLWTFRSDNDEGLGDVATAVAVDPSSSVVFATGRSGREDFRDDAATTAFDARTGAVRWEARYAGPGGAGATAEDVVVSADGDTVIVVGRARDASHGFAVAYHAATGAPRWVATGLPREPIDATLSHDGARVYMAAGSGFSVIGLDVETGALVWTAGSAARREWSRAYRIVVGEHAVYATGAAGWDGSRAVTAAFDASTGNLLWRREFDGRGTWYSWDPLHGLVSQDFNDGADIALARDEATVWVAVAGLGPTLSLDTHVIAYDAVTGEELRLTRPLGSASDYPRAIVETASGGAAVAIARLYTDDEGFDQAEMVVAGVAATTCDSGRDENGPVSRRLHETLEQDNDQSWAVHAASCAAAEAGA